MELEAKYFSKISYEEEEIISFPNGIFGFEAYTRFILIRFDNHNNSMICLQSVEAQNVAFVMINPHHFIPEYGITLSQEDARELQLTDPSEQLAVYNICVLQESIPQSTANLRCPIVVNTKARLAKQIILENPDYLFKHSFTDLIPKEG